MKEITVWKRLNIEQETMEHNHIEDGHVPLSLKIPVGKFKDQTKNWKSGIWEKRLTYLDENNTIV